MRSGLSLVKRPEADPEPPAPTPFPIKIVADTPPPCDDALPDARSTEKRSDAFYEAWDKFLSIEPKRAKKASQSARRVEEQNRNVEETPGAGLEFRQNAALSLQQATEACKAKVAAIVAECQRLNRKYVDYAFNLEGGPDTLQNLNGGLPKVVSNLDAPPWVKRVEDIFDDPHFFVDGATPTDVHQGSGGDCWFLAGLMAISAKKELIERLCVARDEKIGVYGFVFYRDGEWIHEVIDDKLYLKVGDDDDLTVVRDWDKDKKDGRCVYMDDEKLKKQLQRGGEALFFSHCKSSETWLPLIEKAYAKAHGDYFAIEGGFASEAIEDLTGGTGAGLNPEDIMDKDRFWKEQLSQVNVKYLFGGGSKRQAVKGMVGGHAYAVLRAWEDEESGTRLLKLRNPWGESEWEGDWSDGSKLWTPEMMIKLDHAFGDDGVFWMTYADFLKHFPSLNRVRLFDDTWQVSQAWTCVEVPWTVDYLDTKFQFTVDQRGPVVISLSQPDDRYFYGLRGRYLFSMHFRVYKTGGEDHWIVRSMDNSGNESLFTRSVSAEIEELEPGTYDVVFKVTGTRAASTPTAQENILKHAVDRKEKLLYVGRRFDYAQSKGNLRAMEAAIKKRDALDRRQMQEDLLRKARILNKGERERQRLRQQRKAKVMKERRRAFAEAQKAKNRKQRERRKARLAAKEARSKTDASPETDGEKSATDTVTPASETDAAPANQGTEPGARIPVAAEQSPPSPPGDSDATKAPEAEKEEGPARASEAGVAEKFSNLTVTGGEGASEAPVSPFRASGSDEEDESEYESELEPPSEVEDEDFDFDSDMDGPMYPSGEEDSTTEIFGDDPWQALCVLGLRVYSQNCEAEVKVVKSEDASI